MSPGEWIALGTLALAVFGCIYRQGQLITTLQVQMKALPNALKTERRLTRIETVLRAIARELHVEPPALPDEGGDD